MRKNTQAVLSAFVNRKALNKAQSIWCTQDAIYSYGTCIAFRVSEDLVIVNVTVYSRTTTRHQRSILEWLARDIIKVNGLDRNVNETALVRKAREAGYLQQAPGPAFGVPLQPA